MHAVTYVADQIAKLHRERANQLAHMRTMARAGVRSYPNEANGDPPGTTHLASVEARLAALESLQTFIGDVRAFASDTAHGLGPDPARLRTALDAIGAD